MLSEEQLDFFAEATTDIFQELENDIIADIARRVKKTERWTETAELQAEALRELGWSPYKIRLEVFKRLNANEEYRNFIDENTLAHKAEQQKAIDAAIEELKSRCPEIAQDVGNMAFRNDLSLWAEAGKTLTRGTAVDKLIKEMGKRAQGELINLTKTMAFKTVTGTTVPAARAYYHAVNNALTQVVTGTMGSQEACRRAVRELARSGLRHVDYASGVTRQLDTAAMNCLRTSMGQLTGDIMQANIEESGVEYVQVSAHWGARPSHAVWQGEIYHVEQFKAICGYGDPSNPDHIYSYNCRHNHYPYWPGASEKIEYPPEPGPFEVDGKTYTYYEATQKQRKMERDIRATKREALALDAEGDKTAIASAKRRLQEQKAQYMSFSDATGIRAKPERLTVAGYDPPRAPYSPIYNSKAKSKSLAKPIMKDFSDVTEEYYITARPGFGTINAEEGYIKSKHENETRIAQWLHDNLGGDIILLKESSAEGKLNPDYLWREKLWDLKNPKGNKIDNVLHKGLKQIARNPGGIIIELADGVEFDEEIKKAVLYRTGRSAQGRADILILSKGKLVIAIRKEK